MPRLRGAALLALLIVAAVILAGAAVVAIWNGVDGPSLTLHGWIALALALGATALLGGGLMWLAFYSSRKGWDDIDRGT